MSKCDNHKNFNAQYFLVCEDLNNYWIPMKIVFNLSKYFILIQKFCYYKMQLKFLQYEYNKVIRIAIKWGGDC